MAGTKINFFDFFTHSLFRYFDEDAGELASRWRGQWMATLFVLVTLSSWFVDRLVENTITLAEYGVLLLVLYILQILPICRGQKLVNAKSGDPQGRTNGTLTLYNWLWMVLGILLWSAFAFSVVTHT